MYKIISKSIALIILALLVSTPQAQLRTAPAVVTDTKEDRVALHQALLDLTNPWTVMCIAAHPDDEDGTSLIVMRRKFGAHTVSLFSTFGEGGQNAIGPELYEELGAIRARETMAAAEIQGSEPYFLGMNDFGYSKSADETFQKWGHEEALRRMVLEIRKLRPDVIITNHSVTNNDHGHHQATARLVVEAFDAAADPKRFPEQLATTELLTPWQVQRLFVRLRGNQAQAGNISSVTIDPNERDPIRGTLFAEQSLAALQRHATQGPWPKTFAEFAARFRAFSGQSGAAGQMPLIRYRLEREANGANALPGDSHNFLDGLRLPDSLTNEFRLPTIDGHALIEFVDQRERVLKALIESATTPRPVRDVQTIDYPRLISKTPRWQRALSIASGISARLVAEPDPFTPSSQSRLRFELSNNGSAEVHVTRLALGAGVTKEQMIVRPVLNVNESVLPGKTLTRVIDYSVPSDGRITVPHREHLYDGLFNGYLFAASAVVQVGDLPFETQAQASIDVAPPVEIISADPSPFVVTPSTAAKNFRFALRIQNHRATTFVGSVYYDFGSRNQIRLNAGALRLDPNATRDVVEEIPSFCKPVATSANLIRCLSEAIPFSVSDGDGKNDRKRASVSGRTIKIIVADARISPNLTVGYIRGFDSSLPNALNALGVESKELTVDEVKTADLQKYSTIVVDNRVYESQPELIAANQKLLDYANAGGTLIVFYHKSDEWNPDTRRNRPQLAPYKLILGNERITDENAPITFLEPNHPLLNVPN
jgi:LmbE family N-acetylglucosaminyl deacetylase